MYENDTPDDGTTMRVGCRCSHEHADPEYEPDRPPNLTSSGASVWVKEVAASWVTRIGVGFEFCLVHSTAGWVYVLV